MIILRLSLRWWCQHSRRDINFSPYLNCIVGPNGCGKTNMMQAVLFALTGEVETDGVKADNINDQIPHGEKSKVVLVIQHDSQEYTITRPLNGGETTLEGPGGIVATGITPVNEALLDLLGVSKRQIVDYVFVGQEQVSTLFKATDTKRAEDLMRLFGVERASKLYKHIGDYAKGIEIPAEPEGIELYQQQLDTCVAAHTDATKRLVSYNDVCDDLEPYTQPRRQMAMDFIKRVSLMAQRTTHDDELADVTGQLTAAETLLEVNVTDVRLLQDAASLCGDLAIEARRSLGRWDAYDAQQQQRAEKATLQAKLSEARMAVPPQLPLPPCYVEHNNEAFATRYRALHAKVELSKSELSKLENVGSACPTCGQELPDKEHIAGELLRQRKVVTIAETAYSPVKAQWETSRVFDTENEPYKQATATVNQLTQQLGNFATLEQEEQPTRSRETLQAVLADEHDLNQDANGAVTNGVRLQERVNQLETQRNYLNSRLTGLNTTIDAMSALSDADAQRAEAEIATMTTRFNERAGVISSLNMAAAQQQASQTTIDLLLQQQAQRQQRQRAKEYILSLRTPFHHEEAPRVLSFTYLEQMTSEVNRVLELFDVPFRVYPDDNLSFSAHFLDGRTKPAKRLSVGQLIVLSLAFRIAVNSTFASQLGLFAPDEPTAGLDSNKLECVPSALERLRELSEARGLQVIFVTHHESLMPAFDNVINLGEISE
jgi:DNA repair exonuclease SbcCD ATPase subunit